MDVTKILTELYSNDTWSVVGEPATEQEYVNNVTWKSENPQPTWSELEAQSDDIEFQTKYREVSEQRKFAYAQQSDPIFFQWQRGEKSEQEWLDSVSAVNSAYPYPVQFGK